MKTKGFTLIEVMIVVFIIAALATMVTPFLMGIPDRANRKIAAGDIAGISLGLKLYRLDHGRYPNDLSALLRRSGGGGEPYLEREPIDPWGNAYRYTYPSQSVLGYDLYSIGSDGKDEDGGGDDVVSWQRAQ